MLEIEDPHQQSVIEELRLLAGRLPEWYPTGPYADHLRTLEPLERREAERLDRLLRRERASWGEHTRERAMREHARPWREEERWTLRKRVWRERRDRERELLVRREQTLLEREQELARLRTHCKRWLAELQELEPAAQAWCAEQAQLEEQQGITFAMLEQLHQRRTQAAERRARQLLAQADLRAVLSMAQLSTAHDAAVQARMIAPLLVPLDVAPVVIAALALLLAQGEYCCADS